MKKKKKMIDPFTHSRARGAKNIVYYRTLIFFFFFFKQKDYYCPAVGETLRKSHVRGDVRARAGAAGSNRRRIVCSHMQSRRQLAPRRRTVTDGPNLHCFLLFFSVHARVCGVSL